MTSGADMGTDVLVKAEVALRLERQLDAAQQITHIGSWEWDLDTGAVTWSDELYRIYGLAPRSCAITLEEFLARVHRDDRERVQRQVTAAVERGGPFGHTERIVRPDGSVGDVQILRSLDGVFGLDQEAIKAAKQWRFAPGTRLGEPVPVLVTIELTFTLR